ncbi:hypothetical protein ACFQT0_05965 [Hymenobacter humi]|uniref:Peptidase S9A N-terminal domain-containing protein n=1 Tax=Hymenobacter humi TaxID=1411620 RepID=A0ABW2U252_9BACT
MKVSGTSWVKNGFYYSRYDAPKAGENNLAGKNEFHKVYFHQAQHAAERRQAGVRESENAPGLPHCGRYRRRTVPEPLPHRW